MRERRVYLNNAAGAFPLAPGVLEALTRSLENPPRHPGRDSGQGNGSEECRRNLARLLDVDARQVVLCSGATQGLNIAILGLPFKAGDLVVSSVAEHNSVLRPLARLERLGLIRLAYVGPGPDGSLDTAAYEKLLREKPRLVALTHGSNVTGRINPVGEWFTKAKEAGAFTLLDAGQTIGHIPVHPRVLNADMAAFSGYKGLRGPPGTGALYVSPSLNLEPVVTGGTGVKSDRILQPEEMPLRLEAGTPNTPAFAGFSSAIDYCRENQGSIVEREKQLTRRLAAGLLSIRSKKKIRVCDPDCEERLPVVSFTIEGMDPEEAGFTLAEGFGISCRTGLHCAPLIHQFLGSLPGGTIRLSPSAATEDEEIEYALEAIARLAS